MVSGSQTGRFLCNCSKPSNWGQRQRTWAAGSRELRDVVVQSGRPQPTASWSFNSSLYKWPSAFFWVVELSLQAYGKSFWTPANVPFCGKNPLTTKGKGPCRGAAAFINLFYYFFLFSFGRCWWGVYLSTALLKQGICVSINVEVVERWQVDGSVLGCPRLAATVEFHATGLFR